MASTKPGLSVTVKPTLDEMRKRLAKKRAAVTDLRTPYARAAVLLDQWVQRNFKSEGANVGGWQPFAVNKNGVPIVEAVNPGRAPAKLLQDTGRLRSSFAPFANKQNAGIGSDLPYAKTHHEGIGLPERQLLPDHNPAYREVMRSAREIMTDYNAKALRT